MKRSTRSAELYIPHGTRTLRSATKMKHAVDQCRGCDLYKNATQGVYGRGPVRAKIMLIGEQPGDQEDRQGFPFVGPAGRILDKALLEAGIARTDVYVTNAVKHFKWRPGGKKRLHSRPSISEIKACRPWLRTEAEVIHPKIIVCMGATAAHAVFGMRMPVLENRGRSLETPWAMHTLITVHPSSLLRIEDEAQRHKAFAEFVDDLRFAVKFLIPRARS